MESLLDVLDSITGTGCFCSTGTLPFFFPQVRVDGGEELAFPLSSAQAQQLIELAEVAPYGQGTETVFDESVRKSWQLDVSQLRIDSEDWQKFLKTLLQRITKDLGVEGVVDAELYKLLLYGEGGHFKAHRDTEKLDAMFGTLIIKLPSRHEGGILHIRHGDEAVAVNFSDPQHTYDFQYAALFADCEHEVTPVTSGYRCCLVYNLVLQQVKAMLQAELGREILPFSDWARSSCPKMDRSYPEFSDFLKSPTREVYAYPALKEIRERMKRSIEEARLDVDCKMVKKGSPHQLVCTKNDASYRRALNMRAEDEARLNQVLELQACCGTV